MSLQAQNDGYQEPPNKRFKSSPNIIKMDKPVAIVLDIEGTVMSKYFYDNVLLPYARENFRSFLYSHSDIEYVSRRIELIKDEYFSEYPEKEQMFNDYFTENAYNDYVQNIKQRQNKLKYIHSKRNENYNNYNHINNINKPIELTESNPQTIIIDNANGPIPKMESTSSSVIVLNNNNNNNNNNNLNKIVELSDDDNDNNNDIDMNNNKQNSHNNECEIIDKSYENEDIDIIKNNNKIIMDKKEINKLENDDIIILNENKQIINNKNKNNLEMKINVNNNNTKSDLNTNVIEIDNNNKLNPQIISIDKDRKVIAIDNNNKSNPSAQIIEIDTENNNKQPTPDNIIDITNNNNKEPTPENIIQINNNNNTNIIDITNSPNANAIQINTKTNNNKIQSINNTNINETHNIPKKQQILQIESKNNTNLMEIDNITNINTINNATNNNKKRNYYDLCESESESESESSISSSDFSILSKTDFYKEKQINLLMEIINEYFDENIKCESMEYLQGLIISNGFKLNKIKSNIYNDCYNQIIEWNCNDNINIYIFSHGTKYASKLLFKYCKYGNLNKYICNYFDKYTIGNKKNSESYNNLLNEINNQSHQITIQDYEINKILFISDNIKELIAAQDAGLTVIQSVREDTVPNVDYIQINDFKQIQWI